MVCQYLFPSNWKWETLKTLVTKTFDICSTDQYLKEELEHIRTVFHHKNNYPLWVINKVIDDAEKRYHQQMKTIQVVMIKFTD